MKIARLDTLLVFFAFCLLFNFPAHSFQENEDHDLPPKENVIEDSLQNEQNPLAEYTEAYFKTNHLNETMGFPPAEYNLNTPQATLEHFIVNSRNKDFLAAAYALNFGLLPDNITKEDAAILAEKLNFIIDQRVNISWDELPDRPDGQIDITTSTNKSVAGTPRRSIKFGTIDFEKRNITFRLQRIKYKKEGPIWLISAQTVENIEPLYKEYGPRKLDRVIPDWISFQVFGVPIWKIIGTLLLIFLGYLIAKFVSFIIHKVFSGTKKRWLRDIANKLATPAGAAVGILIFYILLNSLISFSGPLARGIYAVLLITVISIFTWLIMRIIDYVIDFVSERKIGDISSEENSEARRMLTYVSVGRRIFIFLVVIIAASIILSQFPSLEKLGISLMASAGIATVVVGIAAQSTLGNIVAGIQIAITKPVRIGDAVIIQDTYGFVEDIRFTYLVVRSWDLKRKVIPLKSVISESFDNLSMTNSLSVIEIELHADYRIDVSKLRSKFEELLEESDEYNGEKEPIVQVEGITNEVIKIRCLCSAKDYPTTWDLHCKVREKLIKYVAELEDGIYLSRKRIKIENNQNS